MRCTLSTMADDDNVPVEAGRPLDSRLSSRFSDRISTQQSNSHVSEPEQDILPSWKPYEQSAPSTYRDYSNGQPDMDHPVRGASAGPTVSQQAPYPGMRTISQAQYGYEGFVSHEQSAYSPVQRLNGPVMYNGPPQPGLSYPQIAPPAYSSIQRASEASVQHNQSQLYNERTQLPHSAHPRGYVASEVPVQPESVRSQLPHSSYSSVQKPIEAPLHQVYPSRELLYPPQSHPATEEHHIPALSRDEEVTAHPALKPMEYFTYHDPSQGQPLMRTKTNSNVQRPTDVFEYQNPAHGPRLMQTQTHSNDQRPTDVFEYQNPAHGPRFMDTKTYSNVQRPTDVFDYQNQVHGPRLMQTQTHSNDQRQTDGFEYQNPAYGPRLVDTKTNSIVGPTRVFEYQNPAHGPRLMQTQTHSNDQRPTDVFEYQNSAYGPRLVDTKTNSNVGPTCVFEYQNPAHGPPQMHTQTHSNVQRPSDDFENPHSPRGPTDRALMPPPAHSNIHKPSSALLPQSHHGSQVANPGRSGSEALQYGPPALNEPPQPCSTVTNYNISSETVSLSGNVTVEHPELLTLKGQTMELLKKSCPNFVATTAYDQAQHILDNYGHVTLIGEPGSGKTTIAHQLLKSNKETFMPLLIENPSELRLRDPKEPTLVLFNDLFGKASYSKTIDDFSSLFEKLKKTLHKKRFRVIFTSRNYIFSDAKKDFRLYQDSLFNENSIVDLSGDDSLIKSDKQKILKSFLKKEKIRLSKEDIETIVSMKASYGFPHACLLFSTMTRWHLRPVEFFMKPIDVVIESLQHMYTKNQERFTVFLLLLMSNGTVNIAKLRKVGNISEEVKEFLGESVVRSFLKNRHEHVQPLLGCYLNANGDQYSFRHPTVEDAVAFVVGNKDPLFLVENCLMRILGERVRIHTTSGKPTQEDPQWFHVVLSDDYHEDLVNRFVKEIKDRNFSMVCLHQACSQERFVDELFESLKEEVEYNQLMHNYDRHYNQNMLYWCAMNKSDAMFCKIIENTMFRPYEEHNAIIVCCMTGNTNQLGTLLRRLSPERLEKLLRMSITRRGIVIKQEEFKKHKMLDDKLLNIAARHGHKDVVDMLVKAGFSVNGEKNSIPPLHSCCESGHANILTCLHELGAQLEGKRFDGKTPLHIACQNGHLSMVMKCVELGAAIASVDRFGQTPLLLACENGHEEIAKYLLDNCSLTDEVEYGDVLFYACQGGCVIVVKDILTDKVDNCEKWKTLLHSTAKKKVGHDIEDRKLEIIKVLLEKDPDVNAEDDDKNTPLLIAAGSGYLKIVNILIEKGAELNVVNDDGQTFLHKAAEGNLLKSIPADLKGNIDKIDRNGQTPLHRASGAGSTESITYLLQNEADISAVDMSNNTPLHIAALNSDGSAVKILLDYKADVDPRNDCKMTPLHGATAEGRLETTRILLQHKADVHATDESDQTPLHLASSTWIGGVDVVQLLLTNKANVHAKNAEGQTPLHLSVGTWGRVDTTQALLDHFAEVNAQDESMHTPLHLASLKGHVDVIQLLVDRKADVEARDNMMQTALHLAAENSYSTTVQALLDCKANVNAADKNGQTPLHLSSTAGRQYNVALLLKTADMYAQDNTGETALHAAAVEGMTGSIGVFLENGMNIDIQDHAGNTPLHTCCVNGRPEATAMFLKKGADNTATDKHLRTPLHLAAECDRPYSDEIVNMLLDHKSDIDAKDDEEKTPLHYAALKGLCECLQVLLKCGADINAKDKFRNTPLHYAVSASRCDIVQELLHLDALCDIMDINGNLPIHLAAKIPKTDVIKIMLRHKVDIDARDVDMKTALHIATSCGNERMVKLLIAKGAKVNSMDSRNETPLHFAVIKGDNKIIQHLFDSKVGLSTVNVQSALDLAKEGDNLKAVTLLSQYLDQHS